MKRTFNLFLVFLSAIVLIACGTLEAPDTSDAEPAADGDVATVTPPTSGPRRSAIMPADVPVAVSKAAEKYVDGAERAFLQVEDRFEGGPTILRATIDSGGLIELNPRVRALPGPDGLEPPYDPRSAGPVRLETRGSTRGASPLDEELEQITLDEEGAIVMQRAFADERLAQTERGVEQSWRFEQAPEGEGNLVVRVVVEGYEHLTNTDTGLHFEDPNGDLGIRYGLAHWIDAEGKVTDIVPTYEDGIIAIEVTDELLRTSSYPAVLDPEISPEIEVDQVIDGPLQGSYPDVATDGSGFLTVFRSSYSIIGVRTTSTGAVLDEEGINISGSTTSSPQSPRVAFGVSNYFVVWYLYENGKYQIYGQRLAPDGSLVGDRIQVTFEAVYGREPDVAFDGTNFFVIYRSNSNQLSYQLVAQDGSLVSTPVTIQSGAGSAYRARVEHGGGHSMVVWMGSPNGRPEIWARSIPADGSAPAVAQRVSVTGYYSSWSSNCSSYSNYSRRYSYNPTVAYNAGGFSVAWRYDYGYRDCYNQHHCYPCGYRSTCCHNTCYCSPSNGTYYHILANRLRTEDAAPQNGEGLHVVSSTRDYTPALASDGENSRLAWRHHSGSGYNRGAYTATLSPTLQIGSWVPTSPAVYAYWPEVACASGTCSVNHYDTRRGTSEVWANRVQATGSALDGEGTPLGQAGYQENSTTVAFDGTNYMVAFRTYRNMQWQIGLGRITPEGVALDATPIFINSGTGSMNVPHIAFGGGTYLVTWRDYVSPNYHLRYARVSPAGVVADGTGVSVALSDPYYQRATWDGSSFRVVYREYDSSCAGTGCSQYRIGTFRVNPDGSSTAPQVAYIGTNNSEYFDYPDVDCDGDGCLIAFQAQHYNVDSSVYSYSVDSVFIGDDDVVGNHQTLHASNGNYPRVAAGDGGYLVVFRDQAGDIVARTTGPDGTAGAAALNLANDTYQDYIPDVTFDGTGYFVVYVSQRPVEQPSGSITTERHLYGAGVLPDGTLVDPEPVLISDLSHYHWNPELATGLDGQMLLAYTRLDPDPPYGTYRARARLITAIVPDTEPPVFDPESIPDDIVVEAISSEGALVNFNPDPVAEDNIDGFTLVNCVPATGSLFPLGTTTVVCGTTDNAGNSAHVSFNVTVVDTTPPVPSCTPLGDECIGETTPVVAECFSSDLVDPDPDMSTNSLESYPLGIWDYTCTATDDAGNQAEAVCSVEIVDTILPTCEIAQSATFECKEAGGTAGDDADVQGFLSTLVTADACAPSQLISTDLPVLLPTACPDGSETTVSITVGNANGQLNNCQTVLTVVDTEPPTVTCPEAAEFECSEPGGIATDAEDVEDWLAQSSVSDVCHDATLTNDAPEEQLALGDTTVTFTGVDDCDNEANCEAVATVVDTTSPSAVCNNVAEECAGPQTPVETDCTGGDICDDDVQVSDNAASEYTLGSHSFDCTATDESGNTSSTSCHVVVTDTTAPQPSCTGDNQECAGVTTAVTTSCSGSDICDPQVQADSTAAAEYALGNHSFDCTATDDTGNAASTSCQVVVADTTAPQPSCTGDNQECTGVMTAVTTSCSGSDVCDPQVQANSTAAAEYVIGNHSFDCTATDDSRNTGNTSCVVEVLDTTAPQPSCTGDNQECTGVMTAVTTSCSGSDICDPQVQTDSTAAAEYALGNHSFDCTATDVSGNADSVNCQVEIVDTTQPA
ncbi:MAG: HYR domain-containing protein, partial [bacterium]|nr:HYR domain-containing protein [bacterium]